MNQEPPTLLDRYHEITDNLTYEERQERDMRGGLFGMATEMIYRGPLGDLPATLFQTPAQEPADTEEQGDQP